MSVIDLFRRRGTAPVARERLQILLSHERTDHSQPDLLASLRDEILAVISKHVNIDHDQVRIAMDRGSIVSRLEINVEVPHPTSGLAAIEREKPAKMGAQKAGR
jgi:cell division topological specificity factor